MINKLLIHKKILHYIFFSIFCISCSKKGTLDKDYWTAKQAGVYEIVSVQDKKYSNDNLISDSTITPPTTVFILHTTDGDGFGRPMAIYGSYVPTFLNIGSSDGFAWCVENDDKRLTLGYFDPSIGFMARASLTIEFMGKTNQIWHYNANYTLNGADIYVHQIFRMRRKKS